MGKRSSPAPAPVKLPTTTADSLRKAMNRRPKLSIEGLQGTASAEEAAAVVAALERFMRDTAPAIVPEPARRPAWLEASLREGVARQPGLLPSWI
jgi:hypothetical protein